MLTFYLKLFLVNKETQCLFLGYEPNSLVLADSIQDLNKLIY